MKNEQVIMHGSQASLLANKVFFLFLYSYFHCRLFNKNYPT